MKRLQNLEVRLDELKKKDVDTTELKHTMQKVQQNQNEMDQYNRNKNIEIYGVEMEKNEDIVDTIYRLADGLHINTFHESQIERAHRLPTRNKSKPETIIIQFKCRDYRDQWLTGKQG